MCVVVLTEVFVLSRAEVFPVIRHVWQLCSVNIHVVHVLMKPTLLACFVKYFSEFVGLAQTCCLSCVILHHSCLLAFLICSGPFVIVNLSVLNFFFSHLFFVFENVLVVSSDNAQQFLFSALLS